MNITTLFYQCLLTIPLTIFLYYYGQKRIDRILIPNIYILIIAALFPQLKENIFLIIIMESALQNIYIHNNSKYHNNLDSILSIILSIIIYYYFINKVTNVLPNPEEIKPFLWFLIITYTLTLFKNQQKPKLKDKISITNEQIIINYAKYKTKYQQYIKTELKEQEHLLYAIMIFINIKKPLLIQNIENKIKIIQNKPSRYGIMQIESMNYMNDQESINYILKEIKNNTKDNKLNYKEILKKYSYYEQEIIKNISKEIKNI